MSTITFDTFKYVERLEKAGFAREQASVFVEAQRDAMSQAMDTSLASKSDIQDLKSDMHLLRSELKLEMAGLRGEMSSIKWMVGALVAVAFANFAKQYF
jgi:Protein of unknown function (DUF1640)